MTLKQYLTDVLSQESKKNEWGTIFLKYPGQPNRCYITRASYFDGHVVDRLTYDMLDAEICTITVDADFNAVDYHIVLNVDPKLYAPEYEELIGVTM